MADAADLKSVVRKDVRVRLPPSAPLKDQCFTGRYRPSDATYSVVCVPMVCQ